MVTSTESATRPPRWWGRIPIDLVAFIAIAVVIVVTQRSFLRHGICFNDSAWYFHFGHRALDGQVPYRDYVFQVGPLPIYVDAAFQAIFGSKYIASMYAAMFIKILRVSTIWMIARRIAGVRAGVMFTAFCAFDLIFGWAHHWSWAYAELFITLSGLFFLLASRAAHDRQTLGFLALAGLNAALVVSARQATAVMLGIVLLATTSALLVRKEFFTRSRFVAFWCGFAAGLIVVFGALAAAGALGPAIQQMFLDAPEKKGVHGIIALLDPISGGALVQYGFRWWSGLLCFLGLPIALVSMVLYAAARERDLAKHPVSILLVPVVMGFGLLARDGSLDLFSDVPRTLLTATTALAILAPARLRQWFGIEPVVAIGMGALALASEWALQLSLPGRGWTDIPALVIGVFLIVLASSRVDPRMKRALCGMLTVAAMVHVVVLFHAHVNPFTINEASDGLLTDTRFAINNPVLRGLRVSESRKKAVDWLLSQVRPGSTCFVYGTLPILYEILGCKNPTRVDVTIPDFISAKDAEDAVAILRAQPPEYLISCEISWMNPPLTVDLVGRTDTWSALNSDAAKAMHLGLRSILDRYESVGLIGDLLGPKLSRQASEHWDALQGVRLYHRKH